MIRPTPPPAYPPVVGTAVELLEDIATGDLVLVSTRHQPRKGLQRRAWKQPETMDGKRFLVHVRHIMTQTEPISWWPHTLCANLDRLLFESENYRVIASASLLGLERLRLDYRLPVTGNAALYLGMED